MSFFSKLFGNKKAGKKVGGLDEVLRICMNHKVLALKIGALMMILDENAECSKCSLKPVSETKALKILGWTEEQLLTKIYEALQSMNLNASEQKIKDLCEKRLGLETSKQELEYFEKMYTNNPQEAASVLFEHAMAAVPEISVQKIQSYFNSVKGTFGSKVLVEGPQKKLYETVLRNLQRLATAGDFEGFSVDALAKQECAQVNVSFKRTFTPVRVWKTKKSFYACGDPQFK
jgi:hypothetical protein